MINEKQSEVEETVWDRPGGAWRLWLTGSIWREIPGGDTRPVQLRLTRVRLHEAGIDDSLWEEWKERKSIWGENRCITVAGRDKSEKCLNFVMRAWPQMCKLSTQRLQKHTQTKVQPWTGVDFWIFRLYVFLIVRAVIQFNWRTVNALRSEWLRKHDVRWALSVGWRTDITQDCLPPPPPPPLWWPCCPAAVNFAVWMSTCHMSRCMGVAWSWHPAAHMDLYRFVFVVVFL